MTANKNSHARRVTVSRTNSRKAEPVSSASQTGCRAVAVRLKNNREQPEPPLAGYIPDCEAEISADEQACGIETDVIPEYPLLKPESIEEVPSEDETPAEPEAVKGTPREEEIPAEPEAIEEAPLEDETPAEPEAVEGTPREEEIPAEPEAIEEAPSEDETPAEPYIADEIGNVSAPGTNNELSSASPKKWYIPQQWKEICLPRKIIMILSAALFLFSCLPLFVGVISPGILPPAMIASFFFLCALYWPLIDGCESTWGNIVIAVVAVCVLAGVTYLSFVSGKMISASANTLPDDRSDVTVVVLGCKINGDQPSRMLHARLEAAAEFLLEHPQSHCIVTGGMGEDEDFPEALVMRNYLADKGVSPMRIVMESRSTSTLENINFSAELAEQYNCHERFLIVTDRFHQYRAMRAANDLGIVSYALNVETVWYLAMPYWFREMAAITRDWLSA